MLVVDVLRSVELRLALVNEAPVSQVGKVPRFGLAEGDGVPEKAEGMLLEFGVSVGVLGEQPGRIGRSLTDEGPAGPTALRGDALECGVFSASTVRMASRSGATLPCSRTPRAC